MEPAAPGTEDDVPIISSLTKQETEQERLLSITTYLPSGKVGNVFELSYVNGAEHWYCNLCECLVMGYVFHHEMGKRHKSRMQDATKHNYPGQPESETDLQIAPGEPIPPGFEGVAQIQERLNQFTSRPLIGLEYLFELQEYDIESEPTYLCLLCDKRGDPRTVFTHLASYNHIIQYIQRHFVSCYRAVSPYTTKQYRRNCQKIMYRIAEAIEKKFGRLKPHVVERETFEANRTHYQNLVATCMHFNERCGVTFEELVDKNEIVKPNEDEIVMVKLSDEVAKRPYRKKGTELEFDEDKKLSKRSPSPPVVVKPKRQKLSKISTEKRHSLSSISSISSSDLSDFESSKEFTVKSNDTERNTRREMYGQSFQTTKRYVRPSSRSPPYKHPKRGEPLHPWQRPDYIRSRVDTPEYVKTKSDKLDEFRKLAKAIENDMDRILKQHEKNPEKHPQYNEEWKKFWNKRYKELQAEGKDTANYDFKPEWIEFWNKRMRELHNAEVKIKKDALRKRLGLPDEPAPISFKIALRKKNQKDSKDTKPATLASIPDQDPDVIIIEDKDDDPTTSKRSYSPWENTSNVNQPKEKRISRERSPDAVYKSHDKSNIKNKYREYNSRGRDYYRDSYRKNEYAVYIKPPRVMRDVTRRPVMSPPNFNRSPEIPESEEDEGEINIVGVLRLLTALEEKLGSLGPKIIDLLSKALALEKNEANSSETLLDNEVNCVLFETVKEKLKGQLLANLVNYTQERAFKNAIKKIARLIHFASERKKMNESENVEPIKIQGIGTVDKNAIAKQIASALVLQGKTDVTQNELEQLINAVVGMSEAARASNKPMTTANFLEELRSQQKSTNELSIGSLTSALQTSKQTTTDTTSMEGLSDSDLQTLLQNFKDLCTSEQHSLISYLKKLEAKEPERVERLRKFVSLDTEVSAPNTSQDQSENNRKASPFINRLAGLNPTADEDAEEVKQNVNEEKPVEKLHIDSDEEEYTFEDVFKAAKQNVKEKEEKEQNEQKQAKPVIFKSDDFDLSTAKSLIANIMGQFKASNTSEMPSINLLGLSSNSVQPEKLVPPPILPKNLENFPINLTHLTDALHTAQQTSTQNNWLEASNQLNVNRPQQIPSITPAQSRHSQPIQSIASARNRNFSTNPQFQPHAPVNNFPQTVSYPKKSQYVSYPSQTFIRPNQNFDMNAAPTRGANMNNYPRRPGPGQFDNFQNRW